MRRIRLGTLLLLVVIVALSITVVVQHRRAARREAELEAALQNAAHNLDVAREYVELMNSVKALGSPGDDVTGKEK